MCRITIHGKAMICLVSQSPWNTSKAENWKHFVTVIRLNYIPNMEYGRFVLVCWTHKVQTRWLCVRSITLSVIHSAGKRYLPTGSQIFHKTRNCIYSASLNLYVRILVLAWYLLPNLKVIYSAYNLITLNIFSCYGNYLYLSRCIRIANRL